MKPGIIAVIVLAVVVAVCLLIRAVRKRHIHSGSVDDGNVHDMCGYFISTIRFCQSIIDASLKYLAEDNDIEVCKTFRAGTDALDTVSRQLRSTFPEVERRDNAFAVYLNYLIEATEKIAETSRNIATHPDSCLAEFQVCEVRTIREHLVAMITETIRVADAGEPLTSVAKNVSDNKDYMEDLIAIHGKAMKYDDFNDGAVGYSYLILLYYLQSFVNSYNIVVKRLTTGNIVV